MWHYSHQPMAYCRGIRSLTGVEHSLPQLGHMSDEHSTCDAHSTAAAIKLLFDMRMRYSADLPLVVWRMLANAESHLNRELTEYFKPGTMATVGAPTGVSVERQLRAV